MKIKTRAHYLALTDLVEVISIASFVAIFADVIWVVRDSVLGGFTLGLSVVMVLLVAALVGVGWGLYKYHNKIVSDIIRDMMEANFRYVKHHFRTTKKEGEPHGE